MKDWRIANREQQPEKKPCSLLPVRSLSRRQRLRLRLGKERHRLPPVAAGLAVPQIADAVRPRLRPVPPRDRLAALRTGVLARNLMRQTIRLGSDHDASPS